MNTRQQKDGPDRLTESSSQTVRKRTVFFVSGFDPRGVDYYYPLYRDEAVRQLRTSGMPIETGPCEATPQGSFTWQVKAQTPAGEVHTRYEFLRWDDIVRRYWPDSLARLIWDIVATTVLNLRHGALWAMLKMAWPPFVALFAPFAFLFTFVLGAPPVAILIFRATSSSLGLWGAGLLAAAVVGGWLQTGLWLRTKYRLLWPMRSFTFTARHAKGELPDLEARINQYARQVRDCIMSAGDDEVLLVSHSSGSNMLISVLARALRDCPERASRKPAISLLTLGQWMPMLGCLPQATAFRIDLQFVVSAPDLAWVDVSAPPDGCCFALVDPVKAFGLTGNPSDPDRPKLLSPRFAEMFDAAGYANLRRDKFHIHFQYMKAGDKPVLYDYFAITAGPTTLAERFAGQPGIKDYRGLQLFG